MLPKQLKRLCIVLPAACLVLLPTCLGADHGESAAAQLPQPLTLVAALGWTLRQNPELNALRQQHGIAAAEVVIARTYPFNPVLESRVQSASGPDVTNRVPIEQLLLWEVEIRGQGQYRC